MTKNEVYLYFVSERDANKRILVSMETDKQHQAVQFSSRNINYTDEFLDWLNRYFLVPSKEFHFIFSGYTDKEFPLYRKLYRSGAKVSLIKH